MVFYFFNDQTFYLQLCIEKRLLKSVTYFRSFFRVFYYYNICQFFFTLKKYEGVISYPTLDIVYIFFKIINPLIYTCILKLSCVGF